MVRLVVLASVALVAQGAAKFEDKWEKFCGVPDCYTELGLMTNATKAQIRRQYRSLSVEFHPDKNKGDAVALARFNKIARANEVLTDDELRKKLDYYTENPSEYWSLYGDFIEHSYAPKTDVKFAIFLLLLFASMIQPAIQLSKHQMYVSKLAKACLMKDFSVPEAVAIRAEADAAVKAAVAASKKDKGKTRLSPKEEKALLKKTVEALVAASDLPAEFAYPSVQDTVLYKLVAGPLAKFSQQKKLKELKAKVDAGQSLDEAEQQELMETYLGGADEWDALDDAEQDALFAAKAYVKANFDAWRAKNPKKEVAAAVPEKKKLSKQELRQRKKAPAKFIMDE